MIIETAAEQARGLTPSAALGNPAQVTVCDPPTLEQASYEAYVEIWNKMWLEVSESVA